MFSRTACPVASEYKLRDVSFYRKYKYSDCQTGIVFAYGTEIGWNDISNAYKHIIEDGLKKWHHLTFIVVIRRCLIPEVDIAAIKPEVIISRIVEGGWWKRYRRNLATLFMFQQSQSKLRGVPLYRNTYTVAANRKWFCLKNRPIHVHHWWRPIEWCQRKAYISGYGTFTTAIPFQWLYKIVLWLYHPPYTLYYFDSHSTVPIGCCCHRPRI